MMKKLGKKHDKGVNTTFWAYELEEETYLGERYIMTDCTLEELSEENATKLLYSHKGYIETFKDKKELLARVNNNRNKLPKELK